MSHPHPHASPGWTRGLRWAALGCALSISGLLSACATNGEIGFQGHPMDCAIGVPHSDCVPGTAGAINAANLRAPPVVVAVPMVAAPSAPLGGCQRGHWVQSVTDQGRVVVLEDSSVWLVGLDNAKTALWPPDTKVVACGSGLVNLTNGDTAGAQRVR